MDLAIWAHMALGGDFTVLSAGDAVNGETAAETGTVRFGLGNTARIYLASDGTLRIEGGQWCALYRTDDHGRRKPGGYWQIKPHRRVDGGWHDNAKQ
jgi:hypothetical protein